MSFAAETMRNAGSISRERGRTRRRMRNRPVQRFKRPLERHFRPKERKRQGRNRRQMKRLRAGPETEKQTGRRRRYGGRLKTSAPATRHILKSRDSSSHRASPHFRHRLTRFFPPSQSLFRRQHRKENSMRRNATGSRFSRTHEFSRSRETTWSITAGWTCCSMHLPHG